MKLYLAKIIIVVEHAVANGIGSVYFAVAATAQSSG
jgi:hypothetical protein